MKEINLVELDNKIKEMNLCEINTTSEDNKDNQYLEFETVSATRQIQLWYKLLW